MPSPTMVRGLLGNFPLGADPPANNPHATTPPVRSPGWPHSVPIPPGGWTGGGGGEGEKTHPPPEQPGSNLPMAETAQRDEAQRRRQTRRWRRRMEPAVQDTRPNTPPTQLPLRLKTVCTRVASTKRWRQRRRWEANPVRGLRQRRTATGPQHTARGPSARRGVTKTPEGELREGNGQQRDRGEGPPQTVVRA